MNIKKIIIESKIIAIIRGVDNDKIIPTCEALLKGGVKCAEITFNQSSDTGNIDTYNAIKLLSEKLGADICIGAGTVMTIEQVELAISAGAKYIISPNFDKEVVTVTKKLGAISIPGVFTPSEIVDAYNTGADFVKVFPAGELGIGYLKAIRAPISHIPMMAVGGVNLDNIKDFLDIGINGVGLGSSLVNKNFIVNGNFGKLTKLAEKFMTQIQGE